MYACKTVIHIHSRVENKYEVRFFYFVVQCACVFSLNEHWSGEKRKNRIDRNEYQFFLHFWHTFSLVEQEWVKLWLLYVSGWYVIVASHCLFTVLKIRGRLERWTIVDTLLTNDRWLSSSEQTQYKKRWYEFLGQHPHSSEGEQYKIFSKCCRSNHNKTCFSRTPHANSSTIFTRVQIIMIWMGKSLMWSDHPEQMIFFFLNALQYGLSVSCIYSLFWNINFQEATRIMCMR